MRIDQSRKTRRDRVLARWREQWRERQRCHVELRCDLVGEMRDDRVLAPFRSRRERRHRCARLDAFADALERLVVAIFHQRVERRNERDVVERIAAEDRAELLEQADAIAQENKAALVQVIGHIAVLYRPAEDPVIVFPAAKKTSMTASKTKKNGGKKAPPKVIRASKGRR